MEFHKFGFVLFLFHLLYQLPQAQQPVERDTNRHDTVTKKRFTDFELEYKTFQDTINAKFAKFESEAWQRYETFRGEPKSHRSIDSLDREDTITKCLSVGNIQAPVAHHSQPWPTRKITIPKNQSSTLFSFRFYNTPCEVSLSDSQRIKLPAIKQKYISAAWKSLKTEQTDLTLLDCLSYREALNLSDWGYIDFLKTLTEAFYGGTCPEAVLTQTYLLTQSGYTARLIKSHNFLWLTVPFLEKIDNFKSVTIKDTLFYFVTKPIPASRYSVCEHEFPPKAISSLYQSGVPRLIENLAPIKTFTAEKYPSLFANIAVNSNLMDYYKNYPTSKQWPYYVITSLSNTVKRSLYPVLKVQLEFKNQQEAVSLLLDFVNTAFLYQTDKEQFNEERPLFGDEMFFYPFNDCEDRAILFAILVREMLELDVVLVHYPGNPKKPENPGHLATAVKFTDTRPAGNYFSLEDGDYVICDPTPDNTSIGKWKKRYQDGLPNIIRIQ